MAKSDRGLSGIKLENATKKQVTPTFSGNKHINAYDTETHNGSVFMLSYAYHDKSGVIGNKSVEELTGEEIHSIICGYQARSAINVWYNLDFDANAILSQLLTKKELTVLHNTNSVVSEIGNNTYEIVYIKGKFLSFKDGNNNNIRHYDISQFFYTSLDNAAENWLGKNKKDGIDTERFNDKSYIQDNYMTIEEYAEKDAKLTRELATEMIELAESLNIPMGMPISTGYLSAEYLRANTETKPSLCNQDLQSMFWDSYYGGRFEVFKRGNVGEVIAPDINSAYPAIMKDLPAPNTMDWKKLSNVEDSGLFPPESFDVSDLRNCDYGVVNATVTTNPSKKIQPFARKVGGKVKYPVMTETEVTVILPIFLFALDNDLLIDYDLKKAWVGNETNETTYPFKFIEDIYAERKVFEDLKGEMKKGILLKIVLNSGYGKTCQTTDKKELIELEDGEEYKLEKHQSLEPKEFLSINEREYLNDNQEIIASRFAGKRFNPFFAAYITGMTRLELHKQVVNHGLEENTIMFATDCLMIEAEAYRNSDFDSLVVNPNPELPESEFREKAIESLGMWDFDYEGNAFVVGSGVYEVELETGKYTKTRGYNENDLGGSLVELAKKHKEGIPISSERPLSIAEVLIDPERGNVSQFVSDSQTNRTLSPDFDDKRNWAIGNVDFNFLLNNVEDSQPIDLIEKQEKVIQKAQEMRLENKDGETITEALALD